MRDFSLERYGNLLSDLGGTGYCILPVSELLRGRGVSPWIALRHDVDRREDRAVAMARLEGALNVRATYYFRVGPRMAAPGTLREISSLGHEVGYHYEVLSKAGGNPERARKIFVKELSYLRAFVEVQTASMHGSPLSRWNNLSFWKNSSPEDFGLMGEAYLSFERFSGAIYLSETGGAWNSGDNLRDRFSPGGPVMPGPFSSTDELTAFLGKKPSPQIYLLVHPNRWTSGAASWGVQRAEDACANWLKRRLKKRSADRGKE